VSTYRLGIDFGTSHTVAVVQRPDGRVEPLLFDSSPLLISAVYAEPNGRISVGRDAMHSARIEPGAYEPHPKRRIDEQSVLLGSVEYGVGTLVAAVLARVEQEATRVIGRPADQVVLTCPAGWGPQRRGVLTEAARAAGLGTPHLVPEPLAAAFYFSEVLGHRVPVGGALVVYDFGAGTFDAAVVRRAPAGWDVLAVDGLPDCGGLDLDSALVDSFRARLAPEHAAAWARLSNPQTIADRRYRRMLWEDVRAAKEKLSRSSTAGLPVPLLDIDLHVTRESFEELARPWLERTMTTTAATLARAGVGRHDLVGVLLAGGSSRIPLVATLLHQRFGIAPTVTEQPELVVAQGSLLAVPGGPAPAAAPVNAAPVNATPVSAAPYPMSAAPYPVSAPPRPGTGDTQSLPTYVEEPRWTGHGRVPAPPRPDWDEPLTAPDQPTRGRWFNRTLIVAAAVVVVGVLAAGAAAAAGWLHTAGGTEAGSGPHDGGTDPRHPIGGDLPGGASGSAGTSAGASGRPLPRSSGHGGTASVPPPPPGPVREATFVHTASGANITGNWTTLSNPLIDNNPNAVVMVTPNWNPNGATSGAYNDHPIGVYFYNGAWAIFNQDLAAITDGVQFNVHAWSAPTSAAFVATGTVGGDRLPVDNPALTGRTGAFVWETANYSPPNAPGQVYDNHATGVYYNGTTWAVFNEDKGSMPAGVAFNVVVGHPGARAGFTHTATAANSAGDYTDIDNAATNGHPGAQVFVTQSWGNSVYNNHNIGVWYHDGKWSIFNQDNTSPVPANATFNVVVYGG
jgi:Hsp70 protein